MPEPGPGDDDYIAVPERPLLRDLPRTVFPKPGEAFPSWMMRLSARLALDPATTMDQVGLVGSRGAKLRKPVGYGVTLTRQQKSNISRATRVSVDQVEGTLLAAYADGAVDFSGFNIQDPRGLTRLATREWAHFDHSNVCTQCVNETGGVWQLSWKLPWHALCLRHRTLLNDLCPECGQHFMLTSTNGVYGPPLPSLVPDVGVCNNPLPFGLARRGRTAQRCGTPLTSIPAHAISDSRLERAQEVFLDALESGSRSKVWWSDARILTSVTLRYANPEFFATVLPSLPTVVARALADQYDALTDLSYVREEHDDHRSGPRSRLLTQTPSNTALMLPLLAVVQPILDAAHGQADREPAIGMLGPLYRVVRDSGRHVTLHGALSLRGGTSALMELAAGQSNRTSLTRAASSTTTSDWSISSAHIPQLWWPDRYDEVRDLFLPSRTTDDYGRRFLSLAAARIVEKSSWRQAAHNLGWTNVSAADSMKSTQQLRLRQSGTLEAVTQHIQAVLTELDADARREPERVVDFRARRERWATEDAIDRRDWRAVSDSTPTTRLLRAAAAWRWEHVGYNRIEEYPVFLAEPPDMDAFGEEETEPGRYRRFVSDLALDPDLAARLAERLANT